MENKTTQSLCFMIENARKEMIIAVNRVIEKTNLPPYLIEGILTGILADIRNQKVAELTEEIVSLQIQTEQSEPTEEVKEGE